MKFLLALLLSILMPGAAFSMSDASFRKLMSDIREERYKPVENFLEKHRESMRKDPEYYVVLLNFVLAKGYRAGIAVAQGKASDGDFVLRSTDGKSVGFMGPRSSYDEKLVLDGISRTESALSEFKSRLDIRFGLISAAERIKRWDIVARNLSEALRLSREIDNKWSWGPVSSMEGDPKEFLLENTLARTSMLFRAETPESDRALIEVSQALAKHYPEFPYGHTNLGVLYLAKKDYVRAEEHLRAAEKVAPDDEVVQDNLLKLSEMRGK